MKNCYVCNTALNPVFKNAPDQYDNALDISFTGGYAEFIDATYSVTICHECAHTLCEQNPWIDKLLQPEKSHAHIPGSVPPDHKGWDLIP